MIPAHGVLTHIELGRHLGHGELVWHVHRRVIATDVDYHTTYQTTGCLSPRLAPESDYPG